MRATDPSLPRLSAVGITTVASGVVFLALAALNRSGATHDVDRAVFLWLQAFRDPTFDVVGHADDVLGRVVPTFAVAATVAILLAWRSPRSAWAWAVPLTIVITGLLEFVAKLSFSRGLHLGEVLAAARELVGLHYYAAGSFPSGHIARAGFLALVTARFAPPLAAVPFAIFALVTFLARLYTEAHRLSDVLGGAALGLFVASAAIWAQAHLQRRSVGHEASR